MKKPVVVVIDDEPSSREVSQRYFEHAGFTVHTACAPRLGCSRSPDPVEAIARVVARWRVFAGA